MSDLVGEVMGRVLNEKKFDIGEFVRFAESLQRGYLHRIVLDADWDLGGASPGRRIPVRPH